MRGAKPSSGLVHLHKSFVELHFFSRTLPQNVSVVACVDGKALDTVLPGQVYATNGQDHWLLGLQFIFKAHKEPVITHVDKTADSTITVAIATQGLQDKYCSADPARRAELQRSMEAAALKFAQTAVMRKEGRLQVSGPNINIPKKQLRSQWPAILERSAPQDVTAHIFVDSADSYIACAAKIILTKAKAEPVFYLSGLSQLLKSFRGSSVTLELLPEQQVVRLNISTGQASSRPASMSTNTAAATQQGEQHGEASSAATLPAHAQDSAAATDGADMPLQAEQQAVAVGRRRGHAAGVSPRKRSAAAGRTAQQPHSTASDEQCLNAAGSNAAAVLVEGSTSSSKGAEAAETWSQQRIAAAAPAAEAAAHEVSGAATRKQQCSRPLAGLLPRGDMLEGMASSAVVQTSASPVALPSSSLPDDAAAGLVIRQQQAIAAPAAAGPAAAKAGAIRGLQLLPGQLGNSAPAAAAAKAAAGPGSSMPEAAAAPAGIGSGAVASCDGVAPGSDAGLWLLADHAAQLHAVGSCGDLTLAAAAASSSAASTATGLAQRHQQTGSRLPVNSSISRAHLAQLHLPNPTQAAAAAVAALDGAINTAALPSAELAPGSGWGSSSGQQPQGRVAELSDQHVQQLNSGTCVPAASCDASQLMSHGFRGRECQIESWQVHPKRRRTTSHNASSSRARQQEQQQLLEVGCCLQDMRHDELAQMHSSSYSTAMELCSWEAAAQAAAGDAMLVRGVPAQLAYVHPHQQYSLQQQQQQHLAEHAAAAAWQPAANAYACLATQQHVPDISASMAASDVKGARDVRHSSRSDDVMALAQQHEALGGMGGAVAVVKRVLRVPAKQQAAAASGMYAQWPPAVVAWPDQASCYAAADAQVATRPAEPASAGAAAAVPGLCGCSNATNSPQLLSGAVLLTSDCSPALQQHIGSPFSNTSSHSRLLAGGSSSCAPCSTPSSCSPACVAMGTAVAAVQGDVSRSQQGSAGGVFTAPNMHVFAGLQAQSAAALMHAQPAQQGDLHWQQQQLQQANTVLDSVEAAAQCSPSVLPDNRQQQQTMRADTACAAAAAAAAAGVAGAVDGWPLLPDADNLLVVGKALVQVMNLLGAGSAARLALTRSLRGMSAQDREWLLSITYPHLQDSCRRRALPEVALILNEVAGMDCLRPAAAAAAGGGGRAAAGGALATAGAGAAGGVVRAEDVGAAS